MTKVIKIILILTVSAMVGAFAAIIGRSFVEDIPVTELLDRFSLQWSDIPYLLAMILSLTAVILLAITGHEAGHLLAGLMTGYRFVSFRIGNLTFIRKDGRLQLRTFSIAGTGGQCLMLPPDCDIDNMPVFWYNAGGVVMNIILAAIATILFFAFDSVFSNVLFGTAVLINMLLALTNGIPMRIGGITNDGYNALMLNRMPDTKRNVMNMLRINAAAQEGIRPKDMPREWFVEKTPVDYSNALAVNIHLICISLKLDCFNFQEALDDFREITDHNKEITGLMRLEAATELAFCALVTGNIPMAEKLLDKKLLAYTNQFKNVMSSKQRLLWAIAAYKEKDQGKAADILNDIEKKKNKYLIQGEVISDLAIIRHLSAGMEQHQQDTPQA